MNDPETGPRPMPGARKQHFCVTLNGRRESMLQRMYDQIVVAALLVTLLVVPSAVEVLCAL